MKPPHVTASGHRVRSGCDLIALAEVEHSIAEFGDRYLHKVFSAAEIAQCTGADRTARLAARFAAKEAVVKAFGRPDQAFAFHEIEVLTVDGVPQLRLSGATAGLAAEQGWSQTTVSLAHEACHALAMVVALCVEPGR